MSLFGSNKNVTELIISGDSSGATKAIGRVTNELDRAEREIGKMSRGWGNAISAIGNVNPIYLMGGAVLAAAGGFTALIAKTIETGAELYKMSGRTGIAVESLSALQRISEQTGIPFNDLLELYKGNNKQLTEMVTNLISVGTVMSTQTARDASIAKTEWQGFKDVVDQLASKSFDLLMGGLGRLAFIMKTFGTSTTDIAQGIVAIVESPEIYNVWIENIRAASDAQNEQNKKLVEGLQKERELEAERKRIAEERKRKEEESNRKQLSWAKKGLEGAQGPGGELMAMQIAHNYQMDLIEQRKVAIQEATDLEIANMYLASDASYEAYGNMADAAMNFYNMSNQQNRIWFDVWKAFALAKAIVSGKEAVLGAYAAGNEIAGPILGAIYASIAGAFALSQIAAIASTQPGSTGGGGGVAPSPPSIPRETREPSGSSYNTTVIIYGHMDKDQYARDLIPALEKAYHDGAGRRRR